MLLKRKILKKDEGLTVEQALGIERATKVASLPKLFAFNKELAESNPNYHFGVIRQRFEELFNEFPSSETSLEMCKLRVQYELVKLDHDEQGIPLPERVRQNYVASKMYQFEKLTPSLQKIMGDITKGESMPVTVKKTAVKRVAGKTSAPKVSSSGNGSKETVTQSYIRLFQENTSKKLTDKALAAEMIKAHPDKKKYTEADIHSIRSMFNWGKLSGQKAAPAVKSVEVEGKK